MINRAGEGNPVFPPEDKLLIVSIACQRPEVWGLEGQTHWTISSLLWVLQRYEIFPQISWTTVQRCLRDLDLKPHRMDYYLFCDDPQLLEKAKSICGLYLDPPHERVLLCYDERTAMQAKESFKVMPAVPRYPEKQDFHYRRHGKRDLLAVFEVTTGKVFGTCYTRHRQWEFLDFLKRVRRKYRGKKLTIILDNLQSHKTPAVRRWLEEQKGEVEFVFTPLHASWLNQIEIWFRELHQKCLKRLSVSSPEELEIRVYKWIETYNTIFAHPYDWKSEGILKQHTAYAA